MGKHIVYEGPQSKDDPSTVFYVNALDADGAADGKPHRLVKDIPVPVGDKALPPKLADELLEGSERTKGHKFSEVGSKKAEQETVADPPADPPADTGGSGGGSTNPGGSR